MPARRRPRPGHCLFAARLYPRALYGVGPAVRLPAALGTSVVRVVSAVLASDPPQHAAVGQGEHQHGGQSYRADCILDDR